MRQLTFAALAALALVACGGTDSGSGTGTGTGTATGTGTGTGTATGTGTGTGTATGTGTGTATGTGTGSNTASSTVTGSVGGQSLEVKNGTLVEATEDGVTFGLILLASADDVCDRIARNVEPGGAGILGISLINLDTSGGMPAPTAPGPGTYTVTSGDGMPTGPMASVTFSKTDATCKDTITSQQGTAQSGTVTVTSYDATKGAKGTFSVTFSGGDKFEGSFDVGRCNAALPSTDPTCE